MIRQREREYSASAFGLPPEAYEELRRQVIAEFGEALELIAPTRQPRRDRSAPKRRKRNRRRELRSMRTDRLATPTVPAFQRATHNCSRRVYSLFLILCWQALVLCANGWKPRRKGLHRLLCRPASFRNNGFH